MRDNTPPRDALPPFDAMPSLSDENIGDMLDLLLALVDAYEAHYANPLHRLRERRYQELHEQYERNQFDLPLTNIHNEIL